MFIRLSSIVLPDDCFGEDDREYVSSTIIRLEAVDGVRVTHGYVHIQVGVKDYSVEISRSLWENSEDYTEIILNRLSRLSIS